MNGQYLTYDLTKSDVRYYKQVSTKPALWHCEMELGEYFRIPIIGIAKVISRIISQWKSVSFAYPFLNRILTCVVHFARRRAK